MRSRAADTAVFPMREDTLLAPGHLMYSGVDGVWRCALPDDRFLRLRGPEAVMRHARSVLHGHGGERPGPAAGAAEAGLDAVDASGPSARLLEPFYAGLEARGLVVNGPPGGADILPARTVLVEGDGNPVAAMVAGLLQARVTVVEGRLELETPGAMAEADVVISCAGWLPDARWLEVDRWCARAGVAWHRCHVEGTRVELGPMLIPGRTATYADTRARRLAASRVPDELRALWAYLDAAEGLPAVPWPDQGGVPIVAGLLVADVLAYLSGKPVPSLDHRLSVAAPEITRHPVLPLPGPSGEAAPSPAAPAPVSHLVDVRFGVITQVAPEPLVPGIPRAFVDYTADLAATGQFAPWKADALAGGATLGDPEGARMAAIGEAVERYCGNAVPADLLRGTSAELAEAGRQVLDPADLALYSAAQYELPGFPFVPFTRDLDLSWVPGRDLGSGGEVLVPAALAYLNAYRGLRRPEPAIAYQAFAGIAAGMGRLAAERAALEELIERDAVAIWWASGSRATAIDIGDDPALSEAAADPRAADLRWRFLRIPCAFEVPVVAAFVEDSSRGIVGFGSACRPTPRGAAAKALTEAIVTYTIGRQLADYGSGFWADARAGRLSQEPYRPFRVDRGYRGTFRDDWRDLTVLDLNLQLYLDPVMRDEPLRRLREPAGPAAPLATLPRVEGDPRTVYLRRLASQGLRAISIDLTTSDVARTGLRVVRVVAPGLYQNAPAAFPMLGGARLYREPVAHGWLADPVTEDTVVRHPLPFA